MAPGALFIYPKKKQKVNLFFRYFKKYPYPVSLAGYFTYLSRYWIFQNIHCTLSINVTLIMILDCIIHIHTLLILTANIIFLICNLILILININNPSCSEIIFHYIFSHYFTMLRFSISFCHFVLYFYFSVSLPLYSLAFSLLFTIIHNLKCFNH